MSRFSEYVANKRIALVGPASTLQETEMGSFIDSFDLVVRLNHAWPLPDQFQQDIGRRVDIIYHNMNFKDQPMNKKVISQMRHGGVTWLVSTHPAEEKRFRHRLRRFKKMNNGTLLFRAFPGWLKKRMQRKVKHPNAGIMAIEDLLRFPIKHLYVTGFSFYTTGYMNYPNYHPNYAKKAVRHHDQNQNKSYFCRILARESRVEVDPVIARLLEEHQQRKKSSS